MSHVFKDLGAIAEAFSALADSAEARSKAACGVDSTLEAVCMGQASGLRNAAEILRRTTLTEPCHMEAT